MKTSTVFVRSHLAILALVVIAVFSLAISSSKAAPPSVAANPAASTVKPSNERDPKNADYAGTRLPPGIYTANPSIAIVVIPAPADMSFVKPVGPGAKIPTVTPSLQLSPRSEGRPLSPSR